MEYEIQDDPPRDEDEEDSETIRDHAALKNQSSVSPEDYPQKDRAVLIPEEDKEI